MELFPQLVGFDLSPGASSTGDYDTGGGGDTGQTGQTKQFPGVHLPYGRPSMAETLSLADAAALTGTGDIWLFRGHSPADRVIRVATNSPVNHVGMAVAIDDLPPLLWHGELGRSLPDVWTGTRKRGPQLHRLEDAVSTWVHRYGQRAWLRQLDIEATREMEDAALASINELIERPFPKTLSLGVRWIKGRFRRPVSLEDLYCAEQIALTYQRMGLLDGDRPPNWYDPGRFWSGDRLQLTGATLGPEIEIVDVPPRPRTS